uniref:Uncharacterized protein n=1 Tax=Oryctolagus cuniculus TaxID=9986 RepID=A0A5F9CGX4_RABIT
MSGRVGDLSPAQQEALAKVRGTAGSGEVWAGTREARALPTQLGLPVVGIQPPIPSPRPARLCPALGPGAQVLSSQRPGGLSWVAVPPTAATLATTGS